MLRTDKYELVSISGSADGIPTLSEEAKKLCIRYQKKYPNEREDIRLMKVVHELGSEGCCASDSYLLGLVKKGIKQFMRYRADDMTDPTIGWHEYIVAEVGKVLDKDGAITKDQFEAIKKRNISMSYVWV